MKTLLVTSLALAAVSAFAQFNVAGTSNLWLAGAPAGTTASGGDSAPAQSPVLVAGIASGTLYSLLATGAVDNGGGSPTLTPDGTAFIAHAAGAENGISDLTAPINSLIGVFLADTAPTTPGAALNFQALGLDFTTFAPTLNQAFFIGDGRTGLAQDQTFLAPLGATRLFLGTMDGYQWNNNTGSIAVNVIAIPEPSTYAALLGAAALAVVVVSRRRKA